jgi:hypothetical protein
VRKLTNCLVHIRHELLTAMRIQVDGHEALDPHAVTEGSAANPQAPGPPRPLWRLRLRVPPQWSRPRTGRMTQTYTAALRKLTGPQWSRPRTGRMTVVPPADRRAGTEAAMEWDCNFNGVTSGTGGDTR